MYFLLIKKRKKMINKVKNATKKGFSLVELLVVVAIIGVLAGVGIVAYNNYIDDADEKVIQANATLLAKTLSAKRAKDRASTVDQILTSTINELVDGGAKGISTNIKTGSCSLTANNAAGIQVYPSGAGAVVCYKTNNVLDINGQPVPAKTITAF
jgi:prepilin-type N-terminal cleavage/methylation domain-containing protein